MVDVDMSGPLLDRGLSNCHEGNSIVGESRLLHCALPVFGKGAKLTISHKVLSLQRNS